MLGVIADDLTGAAELGAVGLRHGLRAEVLIFGSEFRLHAGRGGRSVKASNPNAPDLLCITTESRSLPPDKAAAGAAAAARWLRDAGAECIYKKTDSVLRGQVTAELEAIMMELGCRRALLLPANPSLGRTIRGGRYFIHGQPINRTDFARDPEHPRRSANVLRLLAESEKTPIRVLQRNEDFPPKGIFIGEVSSPVDVKRWVTRRELDMLLAGGAETFGAALRRNHPGAPASLRARSGQAGSERAGRDAGAAKGGGELFVCGSTSDACRDFVTQARRQAIPTIGLAEEIALRRALPLAAKRAVAERVNAAVRANGRAILHVGLPFIRAPMAARRLAKHLAEVAAEVLNGDQVRHVFAEGGETAAALLRQMGWVRLRVLRELAPGVATLSPVGGEALWLTIKPGSYHWPVSVTRLNRRSSSDA